MSWFGQALADDLVYLLADLLLFVVCGGLVFELLRIILGFGA